MKPLLFVLLSVVLFSFSSQGETGDRPPHPEPGKCYTKVRVPEKFRTVRERVVVKPETVAVSTKPAQYRWVDEVVVVRPASQRKIAIPATYKTIRERVVSAPERRVVKPIPAKYRNVQKRVLVKAAGYEWKKGKGPHQKIDGKTGDILCYTKVPAVYKTVNERRLVSEASVDEKIIPATYKFVNRRVVDRPESFRMEDIKAVTKKVKSRKLVRAAEEIRTPVAAVYKTVERRERLSASEDVWRSILCQTNATPAKIRQVQKALAAQGYFKGPQTGFYGKITANAVTAFQKSRGLATGGLTEETLTRLGLTI